MTLNEIAKVLNADLLTTEQDMTSEVSCAFSSDLISDILMCTKEKTLLLTGLTNPQIIRLADMIELFGIIFVRGKIPPPQIVEMARERNLPIFTCQYSMYKTSGILFKKGLRSCKI